MDIREVTGNKMNTFQKLIGVSILIISVSVAYYYIIFLPQNEKLQKEYEAKQLELQLELQKTKLKQQEDDKLNSQINLDKCIEETVNYYNDAIDKYCQDIDKSNNCKIPTWVVNQFLTNQKSLREECFKKYPQ